MPPPQPPSSGSSGQRTLSGVRRTVSAETSASFLRAARAGNFEKVLDFLKHGTDINTCNQNGLNALHLASKEGWTNIARELINRGAVVDAATKKGNTALHIASLAGQGEVVSLLLGSGAKVNAQSSQGFTPLYMAAQESNVDVVRLLLDSGANQNLTTEDGFTPIAVALQQGHDKVVAMLLESSVHGKQVNAPKLLGRTSALQDDEVKLPALHIAAKKDEVKAAELLLKGEQNIDATSRSGFTPLHIASHYGNAKVAAVFLKYGANVNYEAKNNITPLHVAAKWGKVDMVVLLVDHKANVDPSTKDGLTPLHCAARSGHMSTVEALLKGDADKAAKTRSGLSPLHMAAQGDHTNVARVLLQAGAPVDELTVDYLTALHIAAHCGNYNMAKLLLDSHCQVDARALNGFTPLHIAVKKNRATIIELLLRHKAGLMLTTESGLTPLHVAAFMGHTEIVVFLVKHGAELNARTMRDETPLHLAIRAQQYDAAQQLLVSGADVEASAREKQTALHIAARLGNTELVQLLLQRGASPAALTKDGYTPLHFAAKEGHADVVSVLLEHKPDLTQLTNKGFSPLHLAAKYGHQRVCQLLLAAHTNPDIEGRNQLTPLHVAVHYKQSLVVILLLEHHASPHAQAKNGYTPLHIAARRGLTDVAATLLEHKAKASAESKSGFTPLHLAVEAGHEQLVRLLLEAGAEPNHQSSNGLTPMHLAAQEDRVPIAELLEDSGARIDSTTKAGYTPLHTACHFGKMPMVTYLLRMGASVHSLTRMGYTPLHQAAQQGHIDIVNLLLKQGADPNVVSKNNQTALSIAIRLNFISVVEVLKKVTTVEVTREDEKFQAHHPETMQDTMNMSDDDHDHTFDDQEQVMPQSPMFARHLSNLENMMVTDDARRASSGQLQTTPGPAGPLPVPEVAESFHWEHTPIGNVAHAAPQRGSGPGMDDFPTDNDHVDKNPQYSGFLVSFMVDARGGAMRGCRHSGVRVIVPPNKCTQPTRITCKLVRKQKLPNPPLLCEGEGLACRVIQMGPIGAKFLGPVIIEVPHFASLRERERELVILRSDDGQSWKEHQQPLDTASVYDQLHTSLDSELENAEDIFQPNRIARIVTEDFPKYFAVLTRIRHEILSVGPAGGTIKSSVCTVVSAKFPEGALTKNIKVGLQAHVIAPELVSKLYGNRVAVSPIVTIEPRRRKFHKPITLSIPMPKAAKPGMVNQPKAGKQQPGDKQTLRLLCSITGGITPARWEDITGTTPLTRVQDCMQFNTTVSARFWLIDVQNTEDCAKMATHIYNEAVAVPYWGKFTVFGKKLDEDQAKLRLFCITDDKVDKTLENQQHYNEMARSKEVEVLESCDQWLEMGGNVKHLSKAQPAIRFHAFQENRLSLTAVLKDIHGPPTGRIAFMAEPRVDDKDIPNKPICALTVTLPLTGMAERPVEEGHDFEADLAALKGGSQKGQNIAKADIKLTDIADHVGNDWQLLASHLGLPNSDIETISAQGGQPTEQCLTMLHKWLAVGPSATGNQLERALRDINREDVVEKCLYNVESVTDDLETAIAQMELEQAGFELARDTSMSSTTDTTMSRGFSLDVNVDESVDLKEVDESAADPDVVMVQHSERRTAAPVEKKLPPAERKEAIDELLSALGDLPAPGASDRRPSEPEGISEDSLLAEENVRKPELQSALMTEAPVSKRVEEAAAAQPTDEVTADPVPAEFTPEVAPEGPIAPTKKGKGKKGKASPPKETPAAKPETTTDKSETGDLTTTRIVTTTRTLVESAPPAPAPEPEAPAPANTNGKKKRKKNRKQKSTDSVEVEEPETTQGRASLVEAAPPSSETNTTTTTTTISEPATGEVKRVVTRQTKRRVRAVGEEGEDLDEMLAKYRQSWGEDDETEENKDGWTVTTETEDPGHSEEWTVSYPVEEDGQGPEFVSPLQVAGGEAHVVMTTETVTRTTTDGDEVTTVRKSRTVSSDGLETAPEVVRAQAQADVNQFLEEK